MQGGNWGGGRAKDLGQKIGLADIGDCWKLRRQFGTLSALASTETIDAASMAKQFASGVASSVGRAPSVGDRCRLIGWNSRREFSQSLLSCRSC
jgi:hypothetical protein